MTWKRWLVLAALAAGIVLTQVGLDAQPETKQEDKFRNVASIPASDMVPTYVASLFFGAFRAVVVDALWIQLKKVEEEKRWYEHREILKLISYFQPTNPEVWSHLGWHSAYNVANGFTDPEKAWEWIKFGLKWLRQGIDMLPNSPYLKYELARTLFFKPTWKVGWLDKPLLRRIESDEEIQDLLRLGPKGPRPLSAFELAIPWLERTRDEIFARHEQYFLTQVGLYIRPLTMDGSIRLCLFYQAMDLWQSGRFEEAKEWFRRAQVHTDGMVQKKYPYDYVSSIFQDEAKFYSRLPELVELDRRARDGTEEDKRAFLSKFQDIVIEFPTLDDGFFTNPQKTGALDKLKQEASHGRDRMEFNDSFDLATDLQEGTLAQANLEPRGLDVDFYRLWVMNPDKNTKPDDRPVTPVRLAIHLTRPEAAKLDLKVTVFDNSKRKIREGEMRGVLDLEHSCDTYGYYYLKVEPLGPVEPWPSNTSYSLRYKVGD
jgi:hypothetical protein